MKKRKLFLPALLFLCCIGGCGRSGEKEEPIENMTGMPVQGQEDAGDSEAASQGNASVLIENGEPVEGIITEQSFEVELDGWGTVTFVSIAPEDHKGAPRFVLAKEGVAVYTFPEDSSLKSDDFVEVGAVSFADYNEDGRKDVIVLVQYGNGPDVWKEARIFLQENPDNRFYTDYPDMEGYRRDAPTDQGPAFYRDCLLEEYLLTQKLTDTVSSVKGTWTDYVDYVDSLFPSGRGGA